MEAPVQPSPQDRRGLRNRLNRISHFDVNVRDVERSRQWYEATTALRAVASTTADQPFGAFGFDRGPFRGYLLRDPNQPGDFPMIHLVQWLNPTPVGRPYEHHSQVGWYRIVPVVNDIEQARTGVLDQGSAPFAPTTDRYQQFHANVPPERYRVFTVHDPDGIAVEFSAADERPALTPITVAHNTADVERYLPFYTDTLGLDFVQGLQVPGPMPNVYSPGRGTTEHDGALLVLRGDRRVIFDWLQWAPRRSGLPYQEPNHLGIVRCVLEVDDLDAAYATLCRSPWAQRGEITVARPEYWDYGREFGARRAVSFTDPEGIGFQLIQQLPPPHATLDAYGRRHAYPQAVRTSQSQVANGIGGA
jgi:catechol 2,3-dioxygenase-like lactoylglutathione lyase family enzyme